MSTKKSNNNEVLSLYHQISPHLRLIAYDLVLSTSSNCFSCSAKINNCLSSKCVDARVTDSSPGNKKLSSST